MQELWDWLGDKFLYLERTHQNILVSIELMRYREFAVLIFVAIEDGRLSKSNWVRVDERRK